ncbi:phosphatidate cytidylyltransferase [Halobacteriovorax sp. JY17]|uniref:phosphatidate cytidylyltransferase n=1 Tax=Halobacteriovorax sp. JY17 TaxID=2014617 RepID=UPI000C65315D|nr:phosphatidate cytidylyltransferase [Halobacteriovorax sp. JY17]PIK14574.1 MAG: hypothetical protein CES88_09550 [Halobacteriovorax sp. JY17]
MSNTQKRIFSALVLAFIVGVCLYFGTRTTLLFILVTGVISIDELFVNFFKGSRKSVNYLLSHLVLILPFIYFNLIDVSTHFLGVFVNAGLVLNLLLLVYLFYTPMESNFVVRKLKKYSIASSLLILLPLMSLASIFQFNKWISLVVVLLLVNFGMDTGAWFFGKNFGKHKLWPSVSPNKTIEGVIGGALTSAFVGGIAFHFLFGRMEVKLFIFFAFLGLMSQVGDLIQSKLKRQCEIKDSSALIPGHGGVYDRIDSLMFLTPFFAVAIKYFYFG